MPVPENAPLPRDADRIAMQLTPATPTLARTVDATVSTSTQVNFATATATLPATSFIRVYAKTQDIYMKWGTTAVDATNFDEIIPANQLCDFQVPKDTNGTRYAAANFIEESASAKLTVIEK